MHVQNLKKKLVYSVLPESLREGANEDPGDFDLGISHHGESGHISQQGINEEPDEWQKVDEKEKQDKEEAGNTGSKKYLICPY